MKTDLIITVPRENDANINVGVEQFCFAVPAEEPDSLSVVADYPTTIFVAQDYDTTLYVRRV